MGLARVGLLVTLAVVGFTACVSPKPTVTPTPFLTDTPRPTPTPTAVPTATPAPTFQERIQAAVVGVTSFANAAMGGIAGSGFIFDTEGDTAFVVTAYHLLLIRDDGAQWIDVEDANGSAYIPTVLGRSAGKDVAVLSICCNPDFHALRWEPGAPRDGERVLAFAYPRDAYSLGAMRSQTLCTVGEVDTDDFVGEFLGYIAHSAEVGLGASGGPLVTQDGTVLGINVASNSLTSLFYTVPYSEVADLIDEWRGRFVAR